MSHTKGEQAAIDFANWIATYETKEKQKIELTDGDYYWSWDWDGDYPMNAEDLFKIYKNTLTL